MATTIQLFGSTKFAQNKSPYTFTETMPAGTTTIDAVLNIEGTLVNSPDGGQIIQINGSISGDLYDGPSLNGPWTYRQGQAFDGIGGSITVHVENVQPYVQYIVNVVGGPTTADASLTLS